MNIWRVCVIVALPLIHSSLAGAQEHRASHGNPWFGLALPRHAGEAPAVRVGGRAPRPVVLPAGEPAASELSGALIEADVAKICGGNLRRVLTTVMM